MKICKKYGIDKENVNEIATKEVRLFLERIRQTSREKKSIKHWIVTEKGHTNTRRIHIHGIFWAKNKAGLSYLLNKLWTAGYSYQGKYVNDRTVNYIVKKCLKIYKLDLISKLKWYWKQWKFEKCRVS